jgi:hypothetical protein
MKNKKSNQKLDHMVKRNEWKIKNKPETNSRDKRRIE